MLWWLVQNTVVAAVLAGVVAVICRFARPSPAVRHALWLVVLIKLAAPPLVYWPWTPDSVWQSISERFVATSSTNSNEPLETPSAEPTVNPPPANWTEPAPVQIVLIPVMPEEEAQLPIVEPIPTTVVADEKTPDTSEAEPNGPAWSMSNSVENLVVRAWLVGALVMAMWQVARMGRFRQRLMEGETAPGWLTDQVEELARALHIRPPEVVVVPGISSPMIWGLGRARLIWPEGVLDHLPESSRQCVLLHELTHLRRRDHWVGWLQLVGACLYWWNPLFWFVSRQVRENAELACDAWVVATLPDGRRAYAEALIEVAQVMSQVEAPAPALSLSAGRRREFERRLIMIMCAGVPCKLSLRGLVVVGLLALTALPGWSPGQQESEKPKPTAPATVPPPPATPTAPVQPDQNGRPREAVPVQEAPATPAPSIAEVPPPAIVGQAPYSITTVDQNDPDARLRAVEQQLQALLKEVRGIRNGGPNKPENPAAPRHAPARAATPPPVHYVLPQVATTPPVGPLPASQGGEVMLSRATYELPSDKSKALSDLFQGTKNPEVTLKIEGDKVTVTTTPEGQHAIGQFIHFLQGKPIMSPHSYYQIQSGIAVPVTTYEAVPARR
jgi:beta-lactamase regulating signal transducer with metallopeptidase domain